MKDNKDNILKDFLKSVFALYGAYCIIEFIKSILQ